MKNITTGISMKHLIPLFLSVLSFVSCKSDDVPVTPDNAAPTDYHQTAETRFVEVDTTKYAYRVLGDKGGIPLIILSPLGSSMDDWDPAITNGLAQKYRVILFDNKGVGASGGKTPDSIAGMARDAVAFIKALGYSKVNLMGFSMGGFIAQQIVLTEPLLVNRIILTGTGPKGSEGLADLPKLLAASAGLSPEEQFLRFGFTSSDESRNAGKLSYERTMKRTVNRDAPVSAESNAAQLAAVLAWAQPYPTALKELEAVTQPALLIQGQKDIPVPVINALNMSEHIAGARLVVLPDAGHAALFQYVDRFVYEASDFLDR